MAVDLHTHTTCSDGVLRPQDLLLQASLANLRSLAICDHDTVAAYEPNIFATADRLGIELVPGIEISTRDQKGKYHILGLLIDFTSPELLSLTHQIEQERVKVAKLHIDALRQQGWKIDDNDFHFDKIVAKPHIARAVINKKDNEARLNQEFGRIPNLGQFIEAWLIPGKPAAVQKQSTVTPEIAIKAIHTARGLAILAHPSFNIMNGADPTELCDRFRLMGIDGFEAIYLQMDRSNNDRIVEHRDFLTSYSRRHGLVISGGSDYHTSDTTEMGKVVELGFKNTDWEVGDEVLRELKKRREEKFGAEITPKRVKFEAFNKQYFDGLQSVEIVLDGTNTKCKLHSYKGVEELDHSDIKALLLTLHRYLEVYCRSRSMQINKLVMDNDLEIEVVDRNFKVKVTGIKSIPSEISFVINPLISF